MERIEDRIKREYDNMKLPESDMAERVRKKLEADRQGKLEMIQKREPQESGEGCPETGSTQDVRDDVGRTWEGKYEAGNAGTGRPVRRFRRVAAAAVIAVSFVCASVTIYAAVKGLSVRQLFSLIWGEDNSDEIEETIACEAGIVNSENTFRGLDIRPVKVIGDDRGLYVVLKITDNKGRYITDEAVSDVQSFGEYEMEFEHGGSASYSIRFLDNIYNEDEKNVRYVALEYIGGSDGEPVSDSGSLKISLKDWYRYRNAEEAEEADTDNAPRIAEGSYNATISYDYISTGKKVNMKSINNTCDVSSLTVMVNAGNEEIQSELIEKETIDLIMEDGSSVRAEIEYGLENEGEYTVVYSIEHPVTPSEVVGVK